MVDYPLDIISRMYLNRIDISLEDFRESWNTDYPL